MSEGSRREASLYLASVKETFHKEPAKRKKFLKALIDFKTQRLSAPEVISSMLQTMKDHWKLLLGFTLFIPDFTIPTEEADHRVGLFQTIPTRVGKRVSPVLTIHDAIQYMDSVEEAFRDEPEKHDEFLHILYTAHRFDDATVIAKVEKLMKGHPNLVLGFSVFLSADIKKTIPPKPKKTIPPKPKSNKRKLATSNGPDFANRPKTRSQSRGWCS